jgi:hypothetical protein
VTPDADAAQAGNHASLPIDPPPPPVPQFTRPADPDAVLKIPLVGEDANRWLFVEKVRNGAAGAWATGSFDPDRNKISITTQDVQRFSIDTGRILINWRKPVVLGIDGVNSELRRRPRPVIQFERDEHGQWVVLEED